MAIKHVVTEIEIKSTDMGYLNITRQEDGVENASSVWLEIQGSEDYPLIIETEKDIDDLCKSLQECKKLLKK